MEKLFTMDIKIGDDDLTVIVYKDEEGNYSSNVEKTWHTKQDK